LGYLPLGEGLFTHRRKKLVGKALLFKVGTLGRRNPLVEIPRRGEFQGVLPGFFPFLPKFFGGNR